MGYNFVQNATDFKFITPGAPGVPGAPDRTFDTLHDQVQFNALNLQVVKSGVIGGKVELTAGDNAAVIQSYPEKTGDFDVTNLYISGTAGQFTAIVGKFSTLAGAEVIEDPLNTNISRSILFGFAVPFTHTGARLTWSSGLFSVIGGINNGWDNLKGNGTGQHTYEFGVAYNGPVVSVTAQTYQGLERISNVAWDQPPPFPSLGHRSLIDAVVTYHISPTVSLVGNYDTGKQFNAPILDATGAPVTPFLGTATWNGFAGYLNWQATAKWAASLRSEVFHDLGGYRTGFNQTWDETTVTLAYFPQPQLGFRAEARWDNSNHPVFIQNLGGTNQFQGYDLQALVKF